MTGFDLSTIQNCYIGGAAASAIYLGSTKIWPAIPHDYSQDYFTIVSLEDNNSIYFKAYDSSFTRTISASTNGGNTWTNYTSTTNTGTLLATLNTGDKLLLKGNNNQYGNFSYYNSLSSTNSLNVEGNIMSLIYGDNFINQTAFPTNSSYNFVGLFNYNRQLLSAEHLILPVTILTEGCYVMMFNNCSSLEHAPQLPATTLAAYCYDTMFLGCEALTSPPELPATTLAAHCYASMFQHCTSLTSAPELPAAILTDSCYGGMFAQCDNLQYIKCLATDLSATNCLLNWLYDASYVGTFIKDANTTWPTGDSGIPSGWTVVNNTPSSYTITISDPDQVLFSPPIINANGYQAGASVSIDMDNVYDQYDGTADDEYVFNITCSDPNLQYEFLYGEIETDEFGTEISSTNAHLDIPSMPSHNLTFTFTLTSNPEASSDEEGGEEEEPEE